MIERVIRRSSLLVGAGLALAACSGSAPEGSREAAVSRPDSAPAAPAHDMRAMPESAGVDSAAGMAGMDHGQSPGSGDPGMAGMNHAAPNQGGPAAGAMDHSRMDMNGPKAAGGAVHSRMDMGGQRTSAGAMDHSRMNMAGRPGVAREMDHAGMSMSGRRSPTGEMDHARMASPSPAAHAAMRGGEPGAMAGMQHGAMTPTPTTSADDKLLTLAAGLARDPAVMARIEADSALRARWEDPAVRRVVTAHAP